MMNQLVYVSYDLIPPTKGWTQGHRNVLESDQQYNETQNELTHEVEKNAMHETYPQTYMMENEYLIDEIVEHIPLLPGG